MARVLVVSFSVVPGPDRHGVQLLHVLRALASRFTVDVLTLRVGDLAYVERFSKTRMLRVPIPDAPLADQVEAFRRALKRQLEGAEYDVVHFRDAWSGTAVIERRRELGYRTVFDVGRSSLGEPRPADAKLAADLARDEDLCCAQSDLVLTPTDLGRRFLAAKGRPERFLVVPPGVDVDRFDAEAPDLPDKGPPLPRVLYAGAVAPGRGVRVLLRAFRDVRAALPARLILAGPIEAGFGEPLWTAVDQLGLTGAVELLGPIENEDMPRVIARASVCVAPTAADVVDRPTACFPTKILEYLACRRPVVAARRSSLQEVLTDDVDGLLFTPGDPRDLADKILRLLGDGALRDRLAMAGQRKVRERFPASAARRGLLQAYTRLLPVASWNPLGQAMTPIRIPHTGSGQASTGVFDLDISSDTNPAIDADAFAAAPPTMLTMVPPEPMEGTGPITPLSGFAVAGLSDDTASTVIAADSEPWIVLAGGPAAPRSRRMLPAMTPTTDARAADSTDGGDGTPAEGTADPTPTPLLGIGLVAGEVEVARRTAPPPTVDSGPGVETALPDELFVAASELLGGKDSK